MIVDSRILKFNNFCWIDNYQGCWRYERVCDAVPYSTTSPTPLIITENHPKFLFYIERFNFFI